MIEFTLKVWMETDCSLNQASCFLSGKLTDADISVIYQYIRRQIDHIIKLAVTDRINTQRTR